MLEQQIEKLAEHVASLEHKQDTANDLLADILTAIREGGLPPAPAAPVAPAAAAAVPDSTDAETPLVDEPKDPAPVQIADVREALMSYRDAHGKDATIELMGRFLPDGARPVVSEIPSAEYASLVAACAQPVSVAA